MNTFENPILKNYGSHHSEMLTGTNGAGNRGQGFTDPVTPCREPREEPLPQIVLLP